MDSQGIDTSSNLPVADQPELFSFDEMSEGAELLLSEEKQLFKFTGERVAHNQARYKAIVAAIAQGIPITTITKMMKCSPSTVYAIQQREPKLLERERERIAGLAMFAAKMSVEGILEDLKSGKVSAKDKGIIFGITTEKALLLSGEATSIIRREDSGEDEAESIARTLELLKRGSIPVETEMLPDKGAEPDPLGEGAEPVEPGADDGLDPRGPNGPESVDHLVTEEEVESESPSK